MIGAALWTAAGVVALVAIAVAEDIEARRKKAHR